ncbi:SH3 domain protein, conserved, putative [Trypanosoma brucei gambiense DAL972]|uniref:SH3 domain protein, conserved, putative n=1 Tax=Trypanosoma brucei gambiense (strain MHOM/CI/86/DAL972) TaxID=679716 RepID=D0A0C7_TRYB9|nr:SH3 domain protein, conserved, putative [Trypanosoma brucei gambiense DAL972]CBH16685.1 SH3 domain protein, conserved, putative [Trypanosoma brucei gambiense DAL972]|eukprot:XP_011778949.1 SH3 domain protein, conserved, putative [Trypanosoma brucei gambiense DAL972]
MYGGYGAGMPSMYGSGMSSMYGGYGGGMPSMYGTGMSSMYGGYGGGMSSVYGGLGGGMSSMYGGGLSSMSGTYGGMGMNGILGNPVGGAIGGNGMNGALALPGDQAGGGLLPSQPDQQQPLQFAKPLATETRRERRARRRQEKEAVERHRQQKKQLAIHSTIEVVGHVLQILFQLMRSGLELFGVGFGTYYSIKALKSIVKSQEGAVPKGISGAAVAKAAELAPSGSSAPPAGGRWKSWVLRVALFILMEILYRAHLRYRNWTARQSLRRKDSDLTLSEEDDELQDELSESEDCSSEEEWSDETVEATARSSNRHDAQHCNGGRVYVAMFDYVSPEKEGFIGFKTGDRFIVDDYTENGWCQATTATDDKKLERKGLVPGNFLRLLERETKL